MKEKRNIVTIYVLSNNNINHSNNINNTIIIAI